MEEPTAEELEITNGENKHMAVMAAHRGRSANVREKQNIGDLGTEYIGEQINDNYSSKIENPNDEELRIINSAYIQMAEMAANYDRMAMIREERNIENRRKEFFKERIRLSMTLEDLNFIITCKKTDVIPKYLRIRKKQKRHEATIEMAEKRMIRKEINYTRTKIANIEEDVYKLYLKYANETSEIHLYRNMAKLEEIKNVEREKKKRRHRKKIQWWTRSSEKEEDNNNNNNQETEMIEIGYKNLSTRKISQNEHRTLNYGPMHVWPSRPNLKNIIPEVEHILQNVKNEEKLHIKNKFCENIRRQRIRTTEEEKCLRKLKQDETIRIIKADKSNKFVIYNTEEYKSKEKDALEKLKVKKISKDPTDEIARKIANIGKLKYVPDIIKKGCTVPELPTEPRMFMQAKIHKENNPLRQMVSKRNTITYNLEKAMAQIMDPIVTQSTHIIKNTMDARNRILNVNNKINENTKLFSMDVEALYPSVNMQKVKRIMIQKLKEKYEPKELKTIEAAMNLLIDANYFKIDNQYYKQEKGAPIGGPISGKAAEIEMQTLENSILNENIFVELVLYIRFVDDILVIWNGETEKFENEFVKKFNQHCTNIKFTVEKEENETITFLDMKLERKKEKIEISIHRKKSGEKEPIHFESKHPIQHKKAGLYANIFRALRIPSSKTKIEEEMKIVRSKFKRAKYPDELIRKVEKKVKEKVQPKTTLKPEIEEKLNIKYVAITYYKELDEWYGKVNRNLKQNIRLSYRTPRKADTLCIRDRDIEKPKTGVYVIPIENIETKDIVFYVGQTKRLISTRIKEHKDSLRAFPPKTKIADYIQNNNAVAKWNETKIMFKPRNARDLIMNEQMEIMNHDRFVINEKHSEIFDRIWIELINENRIKMNKKSEIYKMIFESRLEQPKIQIKWNDTIQKTLEEQRKEIEVADTKENGSCRYAVKNEGQQWPLGGANERNREGRRKEEDDHGSCVTEDGLKVNKPLPV